MNKKVFLFGFSLFVLMYGIVDVSAIDKVSCGNVTAIPAKIPELTNFAINIIQIAVPIILVIMGSLDLFKGVTAQKEDEIKKGQQMFIKRMIVAVLIFFVVAIVKFVISLVSDDNIQSNITECIDCFINNSCEEYIEEDISKNEG